ncbi:MAG: FeoA family protein [Synechococcaceae cyanobacterium]
MPLSAAPELCSIRIESLPTQRTLRNRLMAMGIRPGAEVQVLRRGRPGGVMHVACGILEFMIRHEHAAEMEVSF